MEKNWKVGRLKDHLGPLFMFMLGMVYLNLRTCWCMNEEGLALLRFRDRIEKDPFGALRSWDEDDGEVDHCSWYGVECAGGKVVALNLKDLCLEGTLAPELGNMIHIKAIILRNNSFSGVIPYEIGELKELEVMDLGYNNFTGPLPYNFGNNLSLASLLLDNNDLLTGLSPEIHEFEMTSQAQLDENELLSSKRLSCHMKPVSRNEDLTKHAFHQRVLAASPSLKNIIAPVGQPLKKSLLVNSVGGPNPDPSTKPRSPVTGSSPAPAPASAPASASAPAPPVASPTIPPAPPSVDTTSGSNASRKSNGSTSLIVGVVVGVSALLFLVALVIYWYRRSKITTIKPWATGLSGQLQKAFVTGVPKLKRSELETACEDFSNVVGSSSIGTIYKGTLSSGVEIAVASIAIKSADDWSKNLEAHFRKKIETLSKINHKNFVNLIGYCEEEEPFTRMLVFEYAPNGTLFEHLHIKEAEHLDWGMRLRIAMGMAYCLEHMHQLNPPIPHKNLNSSAITLTEDYAAKISEFNFWNQISAADIESKGVELIETSTVGSERNVYSFGVVLFEMVTARLPYSVDNGSLDDWASDYVRGDKPLGRIVDPTLRSFDVNQVEEIGQVIKYCVHPDPKHRPTMREVCEMLRGITRIPHDGAAPKISPLWWAELEVLSTDGN